MESDRSGPSRSWLFVALSVAIPLLLVIVDLSVLVPQWRLWRAGAADLYPGEHRGLVVGNLGAIVLALAMPVPLFLSHWPDLPRRRRRLLYALLGASLLSSAALAWQW